MKARRRATARGTGKPRAGRSAERTRARLLEAAKTLFAQGGLHGVSVAQIARRARVSAGMINHHFGGKENLYRACLGEFAERRLSALERYLGPPRSPEEMRVRLELLVTELLELHLREPEVVRILWRDVNAAHVWGPRLERRLYEFTPRLATFFTQAQAAGCVRPDVDALRIAGVIYLSLSGLLHVDDHRARVTGTSLADPEQRRAVVQGLLDIVWHGVLPR